MNNDYSKTDIKIKSTSDRSLSLSWFNFNRSDSIVFSLPICTCLCSSNSSSRVSSSTLAFTFLYIMLSSILRLSNSSLCLVSSALFSSTDIFFFLWLPFWSCDSDCEFLIWSSFKRSTFFISSYLLGECYGIFQHAKITQEMKTNNKDGIEPCTLWSWSWVWGGLGLPAAYFLLVQHAARVRN